MGKDGREPKSGPEPPPIKIGWGSLVMEVPKWLADYIKKNFVLGCVAVLSLFNLYLVLTHQNGEAFFAPRGTTRTEVQFSRTFVFWVPDFFSPGSTRRLSDPQVAESQFHERLRKVFGGWTRWKATGRGGDGPQEDGWIYQCSLPKAGGTISSKEVERILRQSFGENSFYVVEMRHQ